VCAQAQNGVAGLSAGESQGDAVTLRFGSTANLNIHLHCLVLDGVYCCDADGAPSFVDVGAQQPPPRRRARGGSRPNATWFGRHNHHLPRCGAAT
jgi:hypothetical protein